MLRDDGCDRPEIGDEGSHVLGGDGLVPGEDHGADEFAAIKRDAFADGADDLLVGPGIDSGRSVWGEVGGEVGGVAVAAGGGACDEVAAAFERGFGVDWGGGEDSGEGSDGEPSVLLR